MKALCHLLVLTVLLATSLYSCQDKDHDKIPLILGSWIGTVNIPCSPELNHNIELIFREDGTITYTTFDRKTNLPESRNKTYRIIDNRVETNWENSDPDEKPIIGYPQIEVLTAKTLVLTYDEYGDDGCVVKHIFEKEH